MVSESVRSRYSSALDLFGAGEYRAAAQIMEGLLKEDPSFFEVYEGLAMTYLRMGLLDNAIRLMEELAVKDPENVMAHSNLSLFYLRKGMKEKAEEEKAKATVLQFKRQDPRPKTIDQKPETQNH